MPQEAQNTNSPNRPFFALLPFAIGIISVGMNADDNDNNNSLPLDTIKTDLIQEHVYGGLPSTQNLNVRQGYVRGYLPEARIPQWVAYHIVADYRKTPTREGGLKSFRVDRQVENHVSTSEYIGLKASRGYVRGHLAPYGVMGGDRNHNGSLSPEDEFDSKTIYEANQMSNIAPQHHDEFNGPGGLWYELERKVQDTWVRDNDMELWVFAGSILGIGEHELVGPDKDIAVPPMFFKIVIKERDEGDDSDLPIILAFLFPHQKLRHGLIEDYLVSINTIESLTKLDFFNEFSDEVEFIIEDQETIQNWEYFKNIGND